MEPTDIIDDHLFENQGGLPFHSTSTTNFIIFSIITIGLYPIWWTYKAWRFFKQKDGLDIIPPLRAIFTILFLYQLMERIKEYSSKQGFYENYSSGLLLVGCLVCNLSSRLPDPLFLVSIFLFVFLLQPYSALNRAIKEDEIAHLIIPQKLTTRQIIMVIVFSFIWLLILLGYLLPEDLSEFE